jgi:hypothetical protein
VAPDRLVATSSQGLAISPQRVVVTSVEYAGDLLARAGWLDRTLEIVDIRRQSREEAPVDAKLARIASLMNKPTLTRGEAHFLLNSM